MNDQSNVVQMKIIPKTLHRSYKAQQYVVTFIPKTKKWKWQVTITSTMTYEGEADTQVKAFREAEKFIEETKVKRNG